MTRYQKYKDSGIEWIGEIPEHWEVKRFGLIFSFYRGLPITKQDLKDEGIPCVSYGEIHSKYGFYVDPAKHDLKFVDDLYLKSSVNSLLNRGDFVFADTSEDIKGSGNFTCLNSDISIFAGYHTIIARQKTKHNYKYLAYYFDSIGFRNQIRREVSGIKVFSITQGILKSTSLLLPNFEDQVIIANYLDRKTAEIDRIIANKQKLITLYEEEKQAVINQAVTKGIRVNVVNKKTGTDWLDEIPDSWQFLTMKRLVSTKITDGPHETPEFLPDGVPFLSAESVKNGKLDFDFRRGNISKELDEFYSKKCKPKRDDIFIVKSGSTTGKIAIVDFDDDFNIWSPLALVRVNEKVNPYFLYYALQSFYFQKQIQLSWSFGTQPNIGMNVIENLKVAVPISLEEQKSIISHVESELNRLNEIIEKFNKQIDLLQEYRTTLISDVVTGKVRVRGNCDATGSFTRCFQFGTHCAPN